MRLNRIKRTRLIIFRLLFPQVKLYFFFIIFQYFTLRFSYTKTHRKRADGHNLSAANGGRIVLFNNDCRIWRIKLFIRCVILLVLFFKVGHHISFSPILTNTTLSKIQFLVNKFRLFSLLKASIYLPFIAVSCT